MRTFLVLFLLAGLACSLPTNQPKSQSSSPASSQYDSPRQIPLINNHHLRWMPGKVYTYDIRGRALAGLDRTSRQYSGVVYRGHLSIIPARRNNVLHGLLKNPQLAEVHSVLPDGWKSEIPESKLNYKDLPMRNKPFEIHFDNNGRISHLIVDKKVSNWESNMLRSIVAQLQMQLKSHHSGSGNYESYNAMEDSITGKCQTSYEVYRIPEGIWRMKTQGQTQYSPNGDKIGIVKRRDYKNCEKRTGYNIGLPEMSNFEPGMNMGTFYYQSSLSNVVLVGSLSVNLTLQTVETTTTISVSPHLYNKQHGTVASTVGLRLASVRSTHKEPEKIADPKIIYDLHYQYDSSDSYNPFSRSQSQVSSQIEDDSNESESQQPKQSSRSQSYIEEALRYYSENNQRHSLVRDVIEKVKHMTNEIADALKDPQHIPEKEILDLYTILANVMRSMTAQQLREASIPFRPKTKKPGWRESAWKVYRDGLVLAGTHASLVLLKESIVSMEISGVDAADVIGSLHRTARNISGEYVSTFYDLVFHKIVREQSYVNTTALLSLADLSRKVVGVHDEEDDGQMSTDAQRIVFNRIIPQYIRELNTAFGNSDNHKTQVYIRAIGNIGHYKAVIDAFNSRLSSPSETSDFHRFLMVLSMDYFGKMYPKLARTAFYNVFTDIREQSYGKKMHVRAAAFIQLMRTNPSAELLQRLAEFTHEDPDKNVNSIVKSGIETAAQLEGYEHAELAKNAQTAVPLLTTENYPLNYAKDWLFSSEENKINMKFFHNIAYTPSEDTFIPNYVSYLMRMDKGGITNEYMKIQAMVTSVNDLLNSLQNNSEWQNAGKKYADNISQFLNIQSDSNYPLQGNLLFQFMGTDRFVTVSDGTFGKIRADFWKTVSELYKGKSFDYTKLYDAEEVIIGSTTELGIPFYYVHKSPTLMKVGGYVHLERDKHSGRSQDSSENKVQGNQYFRKSSRQYQHTDSNHMNANMGLELVYSTKVHAHVGIVTVHNNRHYAAGLSKNFQINIAFNTSVHVDAKEKIMSVWMSPLHPEQNTKISHFSTWPYTVIEDISDLRPSHNKKIIHVGDVKHVEETSDPNSSGMVFRLRAEADVDEESGEVLNLTPDWFSDKIHYSKFELEYMANLSKSHSVTWNISLADITSENASNFDSEEKMSIEDQQNSESVENEDDDNVNYSNSQKQRQSQILRQATANITAAAATSVDISVAFSGKNGPRYTMTAAYAQNKVSNQARAVLLFNKTQSESKPFEALLSASMQAPQPSLLNFTQAIISNEPASIQLKLNYGESYQHGTQINATVNMNKSEGRQKALRKLLPSHICSEQNEKSKYAMYRCENAILQASLMDQINFNIQYKNVSPEARNLSNQVLSYMQNLGYQYLEQNFVNASGSGSNKLVTIQAKLQPQHFRSANISIKTQNYEAQFTAVPVNDWMRPIVASHPNLSPVQRLKGYIANNYAGEASCVLDNNAVHTFNNRSYPANLGKFYHVMLTTIPNQYQSPRIIRHIQARNAGNSRQKEVKVNVGTSEKIHEILMYPSQQRQNKNQERVSISVKIDGRVQQVPQNRVLEIQTSNNVVLARVYQSSTGEMNVDLKNIKVQYNAYTIRIAVDKKMRGKVRGLCGTYEEDNLLDFTTPQNNVLLDSSAFAASYAIANDEDEGTAKKLQSLYQNADSIPRSELTNESPSGSSSNKSSKQNKQNNQNSNEQSNCSRKQSQYVSENYGKTLCFTTKPIQVCQRHCKATNKQQQSVNVHCLPNKGVAQLWKNQIDQGASPDFGGKSVTKSIKMNVPTECSLE